jgi:DNA processing protein
MLDPLIAATLSFLPTSVGTPLLTTLRGPDSNSSFEALSERLNALVGPGESDRLLGRAARRAAAALKEAQRLEIGCITWGASGYPPLLAEIYDAPAILWIRGEPTVLTGPLVAVVGSRAASPYGLEVATWLARDLATAGLIVLSGLARGIDAAAHRGALECGPTIAVLGNGLDVVYPPEHRALAESIAKSGAVVSELPPGTPPAKQNFPRRNRLISGLCLGVVVVEASERSGSLITARLALEQGRDVMAVPGSVLGDRHRGAHALIRDGARIVESAQDVIDELGLKQRLERESKPAGQGEEGDRVLKQMHPGETYDLQALEKASGLPAQELLGRLMALELAGVVRRVPGGRFLRPLVAMVR